LHGSHLCCPERFAAKGSATKIGGYDAFIAVVGCGRAGNGADVRSETALIVAIRGRADIYTVQWAERGAPTAKAPYPSCVGKPQGRFETAPARRFRLPAGAPCR
jgi:hypothetical protein